MHVDHRSGELMPNIATTSLHAMREIGMRTDGLDIFAGPVATDPSRDGRLRMLNPGFVLPSTGYGIVGLRGRNPSNAAGEFMRILHEIKQGQADDGNFKPVRAHSRPRRRP